MTTSNRVEFTTEMKRDYTILVPNMAPIHFGLLRNVFINYGYRMEILQNDGRAVVDAGLKYVHNDICYPALLVIGQFLDALSSGRYDPHKVALMITQTGGGCRASNYIHLLRKALAKAGYGYVPVISLSMTGLEKNSGFRITFPVLRMAIAALAYGDLLMSLDNQTKPYEKRPGDSAAAVARWQESLSGLLAKGKGCFVRDVKRISKQIAAEFDAIPVYPKNKLKVGIVGEIYVKYSALGNNGLEKFLFEQGCEVCLPGILGFAMYMAENSVIGYELYGGSAVIKTAAAAARRYLYSFERAIADAAKSCKNLTYYGDFAETRRLASEVIGLGCKMGEGWLLPGEMMELIENGFVNIVCAQPFGCLPNHIVGKGVIRRIRELRREANIVPIDYDPGATRVNQENRIKLMLAVAREKQNEGGTGASCAEKTEKSEILTS